MKKTFVTPEVDVLKITTRDILTESGGGAWGDNEGEEV